MYYCATLTNIFLNIVDRKIKMSTASCGKSNREIKIITIRKTLSGKLFKDAQR